MNTIKTGVLLAAIAGIAVAIGAMFFRLEGAVFGLLIAFVIQLVVYFQGAKIALSMARARPVASGELPWLERAVGELAHRAEIDPPALYVSPDPQPNAFAAGRDPAHSVICVNVGLIQQLSREEVEAVIGHEMAHIKNRDTLTMTVVAACASLIGFVAHIGFWIGLGGDGRDRNPIADLLAIIVAPIAATLIQLSVSRTREFAADRESAHLLGSPAPMIAALKRLETTTAAIPSSTAGESMAHLYIASPFSARGLAGLFSTHPSMEDRIQRLSKLRAENGHLA